MIFYKKKDEYITQMNFFFSKDKINILRLQKLDLSGENWEIIDLFKWCI